jgi:hypothetical protein
MQAIYDIAEERAAWNRVDLYSGEDWFEDICKQQAPEWAEDWLERNHSNLEELEELCFSAGVDLLDLLPVMVKNTTPADRIKALRELSFTSEVTGRDYGLWDCLEEWVMIDRGYRQRLLATWSH